MRRNFVVQIHARAAEIRFFMADQKWRMAEQNGLCLDKLSTHFLYLISSSAWVAVFW